MSNTLSCPVPSSINPLSPNGFQFNIEKLPLVSFFCQEANIPKISFPSLSVRTPLSTMKLPNTVLEYGQLNIKFMIDSNMDNYNSLFNWLIGLGFPETYDQYKSFISNANTSNFPLKDNELARNYSTATLGILGADNNIVRTITYTDVLPVELSSVVFHSTSDDVKYLIGVATFDYNYFTIQ